MERAVPLKGRYFPDAVCIVCGSRSGDDDIAPGIVITILGEMAICHACVMEVLADAHGERLSFR